jgi:ubiquinone/menaquinone biosynthesis C-methylase UbiE
MHVARPRDVLREMMRVLAPGGRLLVAEPSNLANRFSTDTVHRAAGATIR